jgi:hypothetical protein
VNGVRCWGWSALAALLTTGCGLPSYELVPLPRVAVPAAPVTVEARRIFWAGVLGDRVIATVELVTTNADPARSFATGPPRLFVRSAVGGPTRDFVMEARYVADSDEARWAAEPVAVQSLGPGARRVTRARFVLNGGEAPQGPLYVAVVVPVEGQAALEVPLADPRLGGPRWVTPRQSPGVYVRGGVIQFGDPYGPHAFDAVEPLGVSSRRAFGRWVIGFDERLTILYQTGDVIAKPADNSGLSFLANVAWEPWRFPVAPYFEGGTYVGLSRADIHASTHLTASPRLGAGILLNLGPRLGRVGPLPFEAPMSPLRQGGLRFGYAHWFHTGEPGGSDGFEFSAEIGFGR